MFTKKLTFLLFLPVLFFMGCSEDITCDKGNGNVQDYQIAISDFNKIEIDGEGTLFVTNQTTNGEMWLTVDENLKGYLNIYVANNTLHIEVDEHSDICPSKLEYHVSTQDFEKINFDGSGDIIISDTFDELDNVEIALNGSGDIIIDEKISADYIKISIDGSGDIKAKSLESIGYVTFEIDGSGSVKADAINAESISAKSDGSGEFDLNMNCKQLIINIAGSGDFTGKGQYDLSDCVIAGSGDIDLQNAIGKQCVINLAGSGELKVNLTEKLSGKIDGSGDIYLWGNPAEIDVDFNGTGTVIKK